MPEGITILTELLRNLCRTYAVLLSSLLAVLRVQRKLNTWVGKNMGTQFSLEIVKKTFSRSPKSTEALL